MIKVGVIGAGAMGSNHIRVYSELPEVELVGITDINEKIAENISKKFNVESFTNYRKLLEKNLDAVSVCTPTSLHEKISIDTINAGCHVLVEKPISDTIEGAKRIINVAEKKGVKLMVGHIERFNPVISTIKERIKDIEVISIDIIRVGPLPPRVKDVGVITDLAAHDIDIIKYLTNSRFQKISCFTSKNFSKKEDFAILSFKMENGVLAHVTTNWLTPYKMREINVYTKEKFIKGLLIEQKVREFVKLKNDSYAITELNIPFVEPLKSELRAFIDSIGNDKQPPISGQDGLEALEIALKCKTLGEQS